MMVDRAWIKRNIGFDPIDTPPPAKTFAVAAAAAPQATPEDFQREIIDFDSEAEHGLQFLAFTTATGLSRYKEPAWPSGLAPVTGDVAAGTEDQPLPKADVLVVTWTVDEGHALSRVLTPGKDSRNDYREYRHNYAAIAAKMQPMCPARIAKRLGTYWTCEIGGRKVVVFKSDSHMSQDGPELPNRDVWQQVIEEVQPKLVITTGTAGGIGKDFQVGDVIVSPIVRFDCKKKFAKEPFAQDHYGSNAPRQAKFQQAASLFTANAEQLPKDNTRPPKIVTSATLKTSVVTTDFFGFDTSSNYYELQGLGDVSEMGDAVLGLVCQQMGAAAPRWIAVRNVSDPQISSKDMTLEQQAKVAAQIYKAFGRWSSVCSAIVCWALIAAE